MVYLGRVITLIGRGRKLFGKVTQETKGPEGRVLTIDDIDGKKETIKVTSSIRIFPHN
jgi:hypothetical protein